MQNKIDIEQTSLNFQREILPLLLLFFAIAAISLSPLFLKVSIREISVSSTLFNRLWIASVVIFFLNSTHKFIQSQANPKDVPDSEMSQHFKWANLWLLFAMVLSNLFYRFLWTFSLTKTTIASATILTCFSPIFTALGGWLFLNQKFDRRFIMGLTIALMGGITLG